MCVTEMTTQRDIDRLTAAVTGLVASSAAEAAETLDTVATTEEHRA